MGAYLNARWPDGTSGSSNGTDQRYRLRDWSEWEARYIATMDVVEVSQRFQRYLEFRAKSYAGQSVYNDRTVLHRFCKWLMQQGVRWPWNPAGADRVTVPKVKRQVEPPATAEQVAAVLEVTRGTKLHPPVVLVLQGCRRAGACRALWEDLDGMILRANEKRLRRPVGLSPWALAELQPYRKKAGRISHYTPDPASHQLKKLLEGTPAEGVTFSMLRRAVEAKLDELEVDPRTAAAVMGHSIHVADKHYRQRGDKALRKAAQATDWSKGSKKGSKRAARKP